MPEITVTFPDGAQRKFPKGITGKELAEGISKSLAKKAVAIERVPLWRHRPTLLPGAFRQPTPERQGLPGGCLSALHRKWRQELHQNGLAEQAR